MKNNHVLCVTLVLLCALAPPGCRTQSVREPEAVPAPNLEPEVCFFQSNFAEVQESGIHHLDAKYLFTVPFECRDDRQDLKKAILSQGLRQDFSRANARLSDSARIEPHTAGRGWSVEDMPATYALEECWNALNVYRTNLWTQIYFRARFIQGRIETFQEAGVPLDKPFTVLNDEQVRAIDGFLERSKGPSTGDGLETLQAPQCSTFSDQEVRFAVYEAEEFVKDYKWRKGVRGEYVPSTPLTGSCESDGTNFVVRAHTDGGTVILDRLDAEVVDMLAWRECCARLPSRERIHWTEPIALVRRRSLTSADGVSIPDGGTFVVVLTDEKVKQLASDARRFTKPEDIREGLIPHVNPGKKKARDVKRDSQILLLVKASIVKPEDKKPEEAK